MYFYTNPNEIPGQESLGANILDMNCVAFTLWDDAAQKNQSVVHYSLEKDIKIRDPVDNGEQPLLYINRTDFNQ